MSLLVAGGFLIGMAIGIKMVAWAMNNRPRPPEECKLHSWTKKYIDPEDPDMGSYLVCVTCKQLPDGQLEQFHVSEIP